ncbi:hypothetical protein J4Q44_G00026890 [Coregonus suidteri]|uniref:Uncharacterized protein n=1 Tax=Coregonus suidteri TaxID=861788 RepID=A0AAN8MCA3_9TELE
MVSPYLSSRMTVSLRGSNSLSVTTCLYLTTSRCPITSTKPPWSSSDTACLSPSSVARRNCSSSSRLGGNGKHGCNV